MINLSMPVINATSPSVKYNALNFAVVEVHVTKSTFGKWPLTLAV